MILNLTNLQNFANQRLTKFKRFANATHTAFNSALIFTALLQLAAIPHETAAFTAHFAGVPDSRRVTGGANG